MHGNAAAPTTAFPVARYRLEWRASTSIRLPDFAGSMSRCAFGHASRKLPCTLSSPPLIDTRDPVALLLQQPQYALFAVQMVGADGDKDAPSREGQE